MKVGAAFPSTYLKADDLGTARVPVTIASIKLEEIGGEHKPVAYFQNKERGLVLNKTNANTISDIAGTDEMDDWPGTRIRLYATKTEFQGKRVPCIRIEEAPNGQPAAAHASRPAAKRHAPEPEPEDNTPVVDDDDSIPF